MKERHTKLLVLPHDLGKVIGLFNTHEPPPWRPLRPWTMSGAVSQRGVHGG